MRGRALLILVAALGGCTGVQSGLPTGTPAGPGKPVATMVAASATPGSSGAAGTAPAVIETPSERTLLFDTDVAADDVVALAFLVAAPNIRLAGITVSGTGEAHCAGGVDVVLRLLERLDAPDIPVACGRETPLQGNHAFPDEWREHVDSGSGLDLPPSDRRPSPATAVELIRQLSREHEDLHILATGPLTNLGDALLTDSDLAVRLGPVFIMGGALHVPGNLVCCGAPEDNSVAEWNVYVDPHAAGVVVDSAITPSFVSLDGTNQVPLRPEFAQRLMDSAEAAGARLVAELFQANPYMTDGSFYVWDSLAAQVAAGYAIGSLISTCIEVEEAEGPESGFTRPSCATPNIKYLATVDAAAAEETLLGILNRR